MSPLKIMILGSIGVGKTSLAHRLAFGRFEKSYKATIGVDVYTTVVRCPGRAEPTPLILWDTDGDFGLTIFRTVYLKGASGALIVADLTRPASLAQMSALIGGCLETLPGRPCAAVFNKVDLVDAVPADLHLHARDADVALTTSALSGEGVTEAFSALAAIIERRGL